MTGIYEKGKIRIEGKKIWQIITTPTCLSLNNNSLLICRKYKNQTNNNFQNNFDFFLILAPEKVKNLQLEEEIISAMENSTFYNVKIFWEAPNPIPDFIFISLEKLQIRHFQHQYLYQNKILGVSIV